MEQWKSIKGFEGLYEVSDLGRVRCCERNVTDSIGITRLKKQRILKPNVRNKGYLGVCIYDDGKRFGKLIHRLVAEAFIPNPDGLPYINHKDEDKTNNCVDNLEWCIAEYNCNYGHHNENVILGGIRSGRIDPTHIGMDKKEIHRIASRKYKLKLKSRI